MYVGRQNEAYSTKEEGREWMRIGIETDALNTVL